MPGSYSVQLKARSTPSSSVTSRAVPMGVASRSSVRVSGGAFAVGIGLGPLRGGDLVSVGGPEMLRGVGSPGPPGLRAGQEFGWRRPLAAFVSHAAHEADVGLREGVGFAQFAKRDVL